VWAQNASSSEAVELVEPGIEVKVMNQRFFLKGSRVELLLLDIVSAIIFLLNVFKIILFQN